MILHYLLFNLPSGEQRLTQVGPGGSCAETVVWNEETDGTFPAELLDDVGGLVRSGNTLVFNQAKKNAHDAAIAAGLTTLIADLKQQAKDLKTAMTVEAIQFRATILLAKDQFNDLRRAIMHLRTNGNTVALNATAVHALFAALPNMPDLDNPGIATGYTNKVTADVGNMD